MKTRNSEKGRPKVSLLSQPTKAAKSKIRELYTDNEDLGYC